MRWFLGTSHGDWDARTPTKLSRKKKSLTHHLEKSDKSVTSIVEVDIRIYPPISQPITIRSVLHDADRQALPLTVDAFVKSSSKKLNSDNAEDEPEYHTHQQHIADSRDCKQQ